jgi:formylglycine-generating enzyme required for sulfatase activity
MLSPNYIPVMLLLLTTANICYSQKAKEIEKNMARVNDTLYVHRYETSNKEYNIFLKELRAKDSAKWAACAMDSLRWNVPYVYCEPAFPKYHRHPAFNDFPATNMPYEGAVAYCKWLTEKYNADSKRKFRKVEFVLPAKNEWILAAQGGHPKRLFPWGNYYLVNKKGFYMCNFKPVGDPYHVRDSLGEPMILGYNGVADIHAAEFPPEKTFYTMPVKSFEPNGIGLYNVCGNVAEMTVSAGYAMGGSWNSYGGEIYPTSIKQYNYPSAEVGFRVFMKIVEQ